MRILIRFLPLLATLAFGQFNWTALSKSMPSGYAERTFTNMAYDTVSGRFFIYHGIVNGTYNDGIYSNTLFGCSLNSAQDSVLCTTTKSNEWNNTNGGSDNCVMLAANLSGDSTPPNRHPYFGAAKGRIHLFGGLHGRSGIRDTIAFQSGGVNTTTEEITLDRTLKHFTNRDVIRFTGSPPSPLNTTTDYYLIRVNANTIRVASSSDNAENGTAINLTTQAASSMYRSVSASWHPSDQWSIDVNGTNTWTQIHADPSYHRGQNGFGEAVQWWPTKDQFLIQRLVNLGFGTPEYPWLFDPDNNTFTELTGAGNARNTNEAPNVAGAQTLTFVGVDSCMYYFGDADTSISFEPFGNDLYKMCANEVWQRITPVTPRPMARDNHVVMWIPGTDQIMVHGGNTRVPGSNTFLRDTWLYDISSNTWDSVEVAVLPSASTQAYGVYLRDKGKILIQVLLSGGGSTFYTATYGTADLVPPVITADPSNATVTAPATAQFSITATGATSYQWQKNGSNVSDGSGGTAATYTTAATVGGDNGATFRCIATNGFGSDTSAAATLTVNLPSTGTPGESRRRRMGFSK
jgi:hypothetical protein